MSAELQTANEPPVKRRRGRPATGNHPSRTTRLPRPLIEAITGYAAKRETTFSVLLREAATKYLAELKGQSA
jgi:hypothetical protein